MKIKKRMLTFGLIGGGILVIAGLADIKYKGLLYKQLPKSVQARLDRIMAS